ncbi:MAG: M20/M25/M40 family metallo-hydrolase, partial [Ignavibacteria bacterium]
IGDSLTEEYIIKEFQSYGLIPKGDDGYKQRFGFVSEVKLGSKNSFSLMLNDVKIDYIPDVDFIPLGISSVGKAKGEMVFVGYGINAPELNYNDFKDVDLKDKIAVILRYIPGHKNRHNNPFSKYERTRTKYISAKDAGAKGIILVTGPENDSEDVLLKLRADRSSISDRIPVLHVKRNIIEKVFESNGKSLIEVQKQIDSTKSPNSFCLKYASATFESDFYQIKSNTANIIGFLEGKDPSLKNEVVVIGAHMDHLGDGMKYGSLNEKREPAIHNGADDNASGTAGVLELAEKFAADKKNLKRSFLFMLFGAEEAGLIGSAYFTKSDLFKNFNIVTMINMDMIGRLNENKLIVNGSGTSSIWKTLL